MSIAPKKEVAVTFILLPDVAEMLTAYCRLKRQPAEYIANLVFRAFLKKEIARIKKHNLKILGDNPKK
jgi:hypothetical protein